MRYTAPGVYSSSIAVYSAGLAYLRPRWHLLPKLRPSSARPPQEQHPAGWLCGERWHDHDRPPPLANGVVQSRQEQHQPSLQPHSHTTPELAQRTRQRREQRRTLSVTVRFHVPPHPTLTQRVCHLLTAMHSHYCGCLCAFTTTSLTEAMMLFYTRCTLG